MAAGKGKAGRRRPAARGKTGAAPALGLVRRLGRLLRAIPGLLAALFVLWAAAFYALVPELPDTDELFRPSRQARLTVLAADGSILDERGGEGPPYLRLGEMSPWLPKAVVAIEDRRFYRHFGLDLVGTARAALRNILAGEYVAGGSTITQQLVKNLYLGPERTLLRKLRELYLALWLEARLSKERILELYLNRVYFGAGAWGAEAAARTYFAKPAQDLTLAEAAMLAGVLKAPSRLNPIADAEAARARAALVLQAMVETGAVDAARAARAREHPAVVAAAGAGFAGHFVDRVFEGLTRQLGAPDDDRIVRTTLDPPLQKLALETLRRRLASHPGVEGAVLVLDADGAVRAWVGSRDWRRQRLDHVGEVRRQPGSVFKTFVYAAALARGRTPEDTIEDAPLRVDGWTPRNADGRFHGRVGLEKAFARSYNAAAVRLALAVGLDEVVRLARRLGIESELRPVPSLALGTSEVTLLELGRAFLPFVTGGIARPDHLVVRVQDGAGRVLYRHLATEARVLDTRTVVGMRRLLRAVVARGTGRRAAVAGRAVFGKTGTSQGGRDGWFVGSDGRHLVAVWVGRDDNRPVPGLTGGGIPALIARDVLRALPGGPAPASIAVARPEAPAANGAARALRSLFDWLGGVIEQAAR